MLLTNGFARWWIENVGGEPSAEDRRDFYKPVSRMLATDPDKQLGRLLISSDPASNLGAYDPDAEAQIARAFGVDLTDDADWQSLRDKVAEARRLVGRGSPSGSISQKIALATASQTERRLRRQRRAEEVLMKGQRSKKSRERWRRDQKRDEAVLAEIRAFFAVDTGVRLLASEAALVRAKKIEDELGRVGLHEAKVVVPHWEKATLPMRMFAMASSAGAAGARDFTLHLNEAVLAFALGGDGTSFAKRMLRRMKDALAAEFGAVGLFPPDFFFQVEQATGQAPHLHGVVIIGPDPRALALTRDACGKAGGTPWKTSPHINTQVDIGGLPEPVGWVSYITKFREVTKSSIGANTFAATMGIRSMGKAWYQAMRASGGVVLPRKATPI